MTGTVSPPGLTTEEAAARRARYGPNTLLRRRRRHLAVQFLLRFRSPLVLLLLAVSLVSALVGDVASFGIVSVMVLMSVTLDFVQEHRAERAAERLQASVAIHALARRDGRPCAVRASELVPGDVVQVSAGDLVPADGRVVEARDFFVNQALLTGEPYPVEKHPVGPDASAVAMGTSVVSGSATVVIERTGSRTALGAIAASVAAEPPPTAFDRGTQAFGVLIVRLTLVLALAVILINLVLGRPRLESFFFAVALAVGLTPELLPMIVSVCLARGALRMAGRKVVVKRLAAIQDLGSMDVLCVDKTGTLTEARIRLEQHRDALGRDSERVLQLARLNGAFETGIRSPLDEAILAHEPQPDLSAWRKIDELPFDFERRRVSVLVDDGRRRLLVMKGAAEAVLSQCTQWEGDGSDDLRPLDAGAAARISAEIEALARDGHRLLGIAWRGVPRDHDRAVVDDETGLVFAGVVAFQDPPKASTTSAVHALRTAGVALKILTGDNELVTRHLCAQLALPVAEIVTGADVARVNDDGLGALVERADVFCRVTPAQKNRIILALKRRGHVVGYLGDGINDAPSLHSADVGISVDDAVDVAKEAAALVLLEKDLGVLHAGVIEGRRTFANVMKYIMMAASSNFGNMLSMAAAAAILPFLPMTPVQILVNNFLYDVSELPIPMDDVETEQLAQPQRWDMHFVRSFMVTIGIVSSLFDFLTFAVLLRLLHADRALFRTGWFVESLATQVLVVFVIRTRQRPWRSRPSPWLAAASLGTAAVGVLLPFTGLGAVLGFVPLPLEFFPVVGALVVAYLLAVEVVKGRFLRTARR